MYEISFVETEEQLKQVLDFCYNILYCTPVEFAVQPDCRPPARYFPGGITVNPGGLQYTMCIATHMVRWPSGRFLPG